MTGKRAQHTLLDRLPPGVARLLVHEFGDVARVGVAAECLRYMRLACGDRDGWWGREWLGSVLHDHGRRGGWCRPTNDRDFAMACVPGWAPRQD